MQPMIPVEIHKLNSDPGTMVSERRYNMRLRELIKFHLIHIFLGSSLGFEFSFTISLDKDFG
jgi:hypothetical protein